MNHNALYGTIGLLIFACTAVGCSDGRPSRVPVSGQVLIDGEPLTFGAVRFHPEEGRPSTGELDQEGRFSLSTFEPGDGCPLGTHRVAIISVEELSSTTRRWNAPKEYASPGRSGLSQTIDGRTDSVLIELTWGNQQGPIIERSFGE